MIHTAPSLKCTTAHFSLFLFHSFFLGGEGSFPFFLFGSSLFLTWPLSSCDRRLTAFTRGLQGIMLGIWSTSPTFLGTSFFRWPPTCTWYLRLLLLWDSFPFCSCLCKNYDKPHNSHSRFSKISLQLSPLGPHWANFCRPPFFHFFFSSHNRAVSSFALAHLHFFITCNKLFRSASKFSLLS